MVSASHIRHYLPNVLSISSLHRGVPKAQGKRRLMGTVSAMSLSLEEQEQSPIDIEVFDIFDAPSRLGESSRLLAQTVPARPVPARPFRTSSAFTEGTARYVEPLPAPVVYDGPARPNYLALGTYRAQRTHSRSISSSLSYEKRSLSTLPPPITFDGPSRLRPYNRDNAQDQKMSSPSALIFVAVFFGLSAFGYHTVQATPQQKRPVFTL